MLDFGGPVLKTPFELRRNGEQHAGLPPGSLAWTGPFDPDADADWRALQGGDISERDYWQLQAERFATLSGRPATFLELMSPLFEGDEADLVRPQAQELVRDARRAGLAVAVCTNDLHAFHGPEWVSRMSILGAVDVLVDGSLEHVLKPDPAIYRMVTERLGVDAAECVFVDDQPANVAGASDVGMYSVLFDVTDPAGSYARVRVALGW